MSNSILTVQTVSKFGATVHFCHLKHSAAHRGGSDKDTKIAKRSQFGFSQTVLDQLYMKIQVENRREISGFFGNKPGVFERFRGQSGYERGFSR